MIQRACVVRPREESPDLLAFKRLKESYRSWTLSLLILTPSIAAIGVAVFVWVKS